MIFNSIEFLIFFVLLFFLYWGLAKNSLKLQNILLLVGGYVFYGWSDWRLLSYLIASSAINFYLALYIEKSINPSKRQWLLRVGLLQGVGGLAFFKYCNFFITSFKDAFHQFGINLNISTLNLLVPIGISFFTFKTISYLLDVNKGKIDASKDWIAFFTYVSFFPTILSGPIDRARTFIPQLEKKREFEYSMVVDGVRQLFWGLFKKVVVADYLSVMASAIFKDYTYYNSITLLVATVIYSIELYADFSGYSDMAIGISRLLGFEVTANFNYPFFAENIAEFWRRWHISLTSWLTEYVFTPLSIFFRDYGKFGVIISIIINFVLCGIWHGANWTFVLWGFFHGLYFIPLIIKGTFNKKKKAVKGGILTTLKQALNVSSTFMLVSLTLVLFTMNSISDSFGYYHRILMLNFQKPFEFLHYHFKNAIIIAILFLLSDWIRYKFKFSGTIRTIIYLVAGVLILASIGSKSSFIYFQF